MKLAIGSDLHTEGCMIDLKNTQNADVLILAGDIINVKYWNVNRFFDKVTKEFSKIIYVAGNHEFYGGDWNFTLNDLINYCSQYKNLHFLENDEVILNDVVFIGSTLWTDMDFCDPITVHSAKAFMSDFSVIFHDLKLLDPMDTVKRFNISSDYIFETERLHHDKRKRVVVTHHGPSFMSCHPKFNGNSLNGAFYSNLEEEIGNSKIDLWIHGHTHEFCEYDLHNTKVICNPRGYVNEGSFDNFQLKYIEI